MDLLLRRQLHFRRLLAEVAAVVAVEAALAAVVFDAVAVVAAAVVAVDAVGVGVHLSDHRPLVRLGFEAELVEIHDRRVARRS